MKTCRILIFTLLFVMIASSSVFAQSDTLPQSGQNILLSKLEFEKIDPVAELKSLKNTVKEEYKQGKISKDELHLGLEKIDRKLKAVKEFNDLSIDQKKEKLVTDFIKAVNKKVQVGELSTNDVGTLLESYTDTVKQWDGQGFPTFYHRGILISKKGSSHDHQDHLMHEKCMHHMHMKFVEALDKAVKDNVINASQKNKILQYLKDSMKEMK
ncbi:MAG: hypothetical protein N2484_12000 [Clostridia bacterium]|nr:hypothetical protein [Clostridia bacterium]